MTGSCTLKANCWYSGNYASIRGLLMYNFGANLGSSTLGGTAAQAGACSASSTTLFTTAATYVGFDTTSGNNVNPTFTYSAAGCTACAAGVWCPAGQSGPSTTPCLAGFFCPGGASPAPVQCPAGTYSLGGSTAVSAASCVPCAAGSYAANAGSGACTPCNTGFYGVLTGQTSAAEACVACPSGTFGGSVGATSCSACGAGTYASALGSQTCNNCAAGSFAPAPAGAVGAGSCTPCLSGTYAASTGLSVCTGTACSPGYFGRAGLTASAGAGACAICPAGTYSSVSGADACTPCPVNTFSASAGATSAAACTPCGAGNSTLFVGATRCLPSPTGFAPGNVIAVRLVHPNIQTRSFAQTSAVYLDEYELPSDPNKMLRLVQSIALPNGSSVLPVGQFRLTLAGQDLQALHDQIHDGIISLAQDMTSLIIAGLDAPLGVTQAIFTAACCASSWTANGLSNAVSTHNLVVGHYDAWARRDISTIAGIANNANTGPAYALHSSTAFCTPGAPSCPSGNGYYVDANSYFTIYGSLVCGPWYVPYGNQVGFTGTAGTGSFAYYTTCSSAGGSRTMAMIQNYLVFMYYYSSNYNVRSTDSNQPPIGRGSYGTATVNYAQGITGVASQGYRQWVFFVPVGQSLVYMALADAGLGLRISRSTITYGPGVSATSPTWSSTADLTGYLRVPNNDQALIGVAVVEVAGRSTVYTSSQTGNIYSFDVSSLTWNNNGFPVYSGTHWDSFRGMVWSPRPIQTGTLSDCAPCSAQPITADTAGAYNAGWPNGFVLAGLVRSGATWGAAQAPLYSAAYFGCYAGYYSNGYAVQTCSTVGGAGWGALTPPTCVGC